MNYCELLFTTQPNEDYQQDLLIDRLAEIGFDTFEELETGFKAYIPESRFDRKKLEAGLQDYHEMFPFSYQVHILPAKNWNLVWESNFEPILIQDNVYVRATFHPQKPEFPYQIVIDPKMAFGTGHHQTTAMMLELMLDAGLTGKKILDMGCGTGILAILASKLGAAGITAIDYDPVCYESTIENAALNAISNIKAICGSKEAIPDELFDIVLANINRNILLDQIERYSEILKPDGDIYFSGFYETPDLEMIKSAALTHGLRYVSHRKTKDWVAARFVRS